MQEITKISYFAFCNKSAYIIIVRISAVPGLAQYNQTAQWQCLFCKGKVTSWFCPNLCCISLQHRHHAHRKRVTARLQHADNRWACFLTQCTARMTSEWDWMLEQTQSRHWRKQQLLNKKSQYWCLAILYCETCNIVSITLRQLSMEPVSLNSVHPSLRFWPALLFPPMRDVQIAIRQHPLRVTHAI